MMQNTLTFSSRSCVKHTSAATKMSRKGLSRQPRGQVRMIICFWGHLSLYKPSFCLNERVKMSSVSAAFLCWLSRAWNVGIGPNHTHTHRVLARGMTQRAVSWVNLTGPPARSDRAVCFSAVVRDLLSLRHWGVGGQRLNQDFMLALCVSNTLRVCGSRRRRIKGSVKRLLLKKLGLTLYEMWGYRVWSCSSLSSSVTRLIW